MPESRINPEIVRGAKVFISKRLGVAEGEAQALGTLQSVRDVNKLTLDAWDDVGLGIGSQGVVESVYETGFTGVLFEPTEKITKPFSYDVPTACLSVK